MAPRLDSHEFSTLEVERLDHVIRVTIAHPDSELNAIDDRLHQDLTRLFGHLRKEGEARAAILTGRVGHFPPVATSSGSRC